MREYGRHYGAPLNLKMDGKRERAIERRIIRQMIIIEVQLYLFVVRVRPEKGGVVSHVYSYWGCSSHYLARQGYFNCTRVRCRYLHLTAV